ncbi:MAG: hypothetical protein IJ779_09070 [Ruminococcus sp.]|nr:hypothetical protein [Ruminococcus sp.]
MKIRKTIAFILALAAMTGISGCADKEVSSSEVSSSISEEETTQFQVSLPDDVQSKLDDLKKPFYTVSGDTYELENFRFDISENFTFKEDSDDTIVFQCKNKPIVLGVIRYAEMGNQTAMSAAKGIAKACEEKGYRAEVAEIERSDCECACVKADKPVEILELAEYTDSMHCDYFFVRKERSLFSFLISYADADEEAAYGYANDLMDNLEYTGDVFIDSEPDTYENDYFIIEHDDKWYANDEGIADQYTQSAKVRYSLVDDEALIYAGITLKGSSQIEEASSEERAEKSYESRKESAFSDNVKKEESEILGHKAVCVSMNVNLADDLSNYMRNYYFDENGKYYLISLVVPADDDGTVEKDIEELLEHITLK